MKNHVDFKELLKAQGLTPEQFDKKYIEYENKVKELKSKLSIKQTRQM